MSTLRTSHPLLVTPVRSSRPEKRDKILYFNEVAFWRLLPAQSFISVQIVFLCLSLIPIGICILKFHTIWRGTVPQTQYYPLRRSVDLDVNVEGVRAYSSPHLYKRFTWQDYILCYFLIHN
jgi:hypothetical protein